MATAGRSGQTLGSARFRMLSNDHILSSTTQRRYLWGMPDPESGTPLGHDPDLSRVYRLAEQILEHVVARSPDWSQVARDAEALAALARQRLQHKSA
jgi:hypothetical protein